MQVKFISLNDPQAAIGIMTGKRVHVMSHSVIWAAVPTGRVPVERLEICTITYCTINTEGWKRLPSRVCNAAKAIGVVFEICAYSERNTHDKYVLWAIPEVAKIRKVKKVMS